MEVILLHSENRHVSATQVAFFRVEISGHFIIMFFYFPCHIVRRSKTYHCETKLHTYVSYPVYIIDVMLPTYLLYILYQKHDPDNDLKQIATYSNK
jgi:hypothetical protein